LKAALSLSIPSHQSLSLGEFPYKKNRGAPRTPKRYQDPVLWAWLELSSILRGANSKTTHYLLSCILASIP